MKEEDLNKLSKPVFNSNESVEFQQDNGLNEGSDNMYTSTGLKGKGEYDTVTTRKVKQKQCQPEAFDTKSADLLQ